MTTETIKTAAVEPSALVVVALDALLQMARARDEARARLAEMREERDFAHRDAALALSKLAEVERERDQARAELDEREGDMHLRIRADYDQTVADLWRAKVAEVERERDEARAEVERVSVSRANLMGIATRLSDALKLDEEPKDLAALRVWLERARAHQPA